MCDRGRFPTRLQLRHRTLIPPRLRKQQRTTARYAFLHSVLLFFYFLLALSIARANSITVDEGLHIASGYTILRTGDYRLVEEHPPLTKLWLALPLLPRHDLPDPTTLPAWQEAAAPTTESLPLLHMAEQLLYPHTPLEHWLLPARVMNILLGILLLATLTRWAIRVWGHRAALLVALLAACDPNLLAHGAVAGTDMGATLFIILGLYVGLRFLARPTQKHAWLTGLILGLGLTTKLTVALLGPTLGLAGLMRVWRATPTTRRRLIRHGILLIGICALVFWSVYSFQIGRVPGIPIPLPAAAHATPILRLQAHNAGGHQAFLLGQNNITGWWTYFPVTFVLKTPLPALLLALYATLRGKRQEARSKRQEARGKREEAGYRKQEARGKREEARNKSPASCILPPASCILPPASCILPPASLFALIYLTLSLTSSLNIGYRHLLPLVPLMYLSIGRMLGERQEARGKKQDSCLLPPASCILPPASYLFLLWQFISMMGVFPYPLGFFNELAGGAENGWRYLADSNTDWGQGYQALARYQHTHNIDTFHLSAFIFHDPANYNINYTPLTPMHGDTPAIFPARFAPPPGDYAISLTPLDGIPLADPEMYDWFRWRAPDARIAHALHIYHVTPEETTVHWVAQCITPTVPLNGTMLTEGFGQLPPRRVAFDCTQSWLIPKDHAGRYIVHGDLLNDTRAARLHTAPATSTNPFIARHLADTNSVYRQRNNREAPTFAIYAPTAAPPSPPHQTAWARPAGTLPTTLTAMPRAGPYPLDGPLTFLGSASYPDEQNLTVETWWRVSAVPTRPLSIMAHALTQAGQTIAVADGLGIAPQQWHIGDILIQRHIIPKNTPPEIYLRTGAYWLDTSDRWPITNTPGADALFIKLGNKP